MAIDVNYTEESNILNISVIGKFDFSLLNEFRQAYNNESVKSYEVIVDLRRTTSLDSSALGMLLSMQEYLGKADREIKIINSNHDVMKVFSITHFDKKFTIE